MRKKDPEVLELKGTAIPGRAFYVIVPALSGLRHRYTVYKLPTNTTRSMRILGLELPLKLAREIVAEDKKKS